MPGSIRRASEVLGRRLLVMSVAVLAAATLAAGPVDAITYGQPDGTGHPSVGALIAEWSTPGVKEILCSGTLIAPRVFLTAAHCTAFLESLGIPNTQVWVSFDQDADPVTASTNLIQGQWITNPGFNQRQSDPGDIAVVLFPQNVQGIAPAQLPAASAFDQLGPRGLRGQQFTAVGYGVHEPEVGGGPPNWPFDGMRWKAVSEFRALNPAWLRLSQNDATSDGGTCFGDSGGPNFLGAGANETPVVAAITITGDAMCLATNVTYRLDRPVPRNFLANFVVLP